MALYSDSALNFCIPTTNGNLGIIPSMNIIVSVVIRLCYFVFRYQVVIVVLSVYGQDLFESLFSYLESMVLFDLWIRDLVAAVWIFCSQNNVPARELLWVRHKWV